MLSKARGASHNHQAWEGGYLDHIKEVMNIAITLYEPLNLRRPLPFSMHDALLALFLHDLEKPWKYALVEGKHELSQQMKDRDFVKKFRLDKIKEYGFQLSEEHLNGIEFAEGEIGVYTPGRRSMGILASFVHMCDIWSARGWHNYPLAENDTWQGAQRTHK